MSRFFMFDGNLLDRDELGKGERERENRQIELCIGLATRSKCTLLVFLKKKTKSFRPKILTNTDLGKSLPNQFGRSLTPLECTTRVDISRSETHKKCLNYLMNLQFLGNLEYEKCLHVGRRIGITCRLYHVTEVRKRFSHVTKLLNRKKK
jgi:hypothetical protein